MKEVIRYGAGGVPYRGNEGEHSTEAAPAPVEETEEEVQMSVTCEEDDTPLTEEEVVEKATKGTKK